MKKKLKIVIILVLLSTICNGQNLLNAPQKIVIDKKAGRVGYTRNRLLVSNFNGGSLVEIDTSGNQSFFLTNAGLVDGIEIVGNNIYGVGNNRKVYGYDLDSKRQVMNLTIDGAPNDYLSSITYDSLGHLLISCPNLNVIYRIDLSNYNYWIFAQDGGLNRPNGILLEKERNRIVVIDDSPGSSLIHAVSLIDSTVSTLASTTFDRPDGIVRDKYGYYYIGGYYLPALFTTDSIFSYHPAAFFPGQNMVYPTYDKDDHSLLITYYGTDSWGRIPLTTTASIADLPQREDQILSAYPSPTSSQLTIDFQLNNASSISLSLINISGSLISTVKSGLTNSGQHSVSWNGKDDSGQTVPPGIYMVRLDTGDHLYTQKIIVVE